MILDILILYLFSCVFCFFVICSHFGYKHWAISSIMSLFYPIVLIIVTLRK